MKDDIYAGLRNAVERGEKLEDAVASFVNSGYNEQEVKAAASMISGGAMQVMQGDEKDNKIKDLPPMPTAPNKKDARRLDSVKKAKKEGGGGKIVLVLVIMLLIIILIGVGIYLYLTFLR